jgi:hypothetical protein
MNRLRTLVELVGFAARLMVAAWPARREQPAAARRS